jgi:hypothetical protein
LNDEFSIPILNKSQSLTDCVIQAGGTSSVQVADKKPACRSQFKQEIFEIQLYVPNPPSLG